MKKWKQWTSLLLALLLLISAIPVITADAASEMATARVRFNIRKTRDVKSAIVRNVAAKSKVEVLEVYEEEGWCKVAFGGHSGYAKMEWLIFPEGSAYADQSYDASSGSESTQKPSAQATPAPASTSETDDDGDGDLDSGTADEYTLEGIIKDDSRGKFKTPKATDEPVKPTLTSFDAREAVPKPTGIAVGESDTDEIAYIAKARAEFTIKEAPDDKSRRVFTVKKKSKVRVLAYGDEWCKVQTKNGQYTGYCHTKNIYHFHSCDPFKYGVPWFDSYQATGYITIKDPVHITDHNDMYGGQDLQTGDLICVIKRDDGDYDMTLRRDFVTLSEFVGEYQEFVPWDEAKEGDIIGGGTVHYGLTQGGAFRRNRQRNISIAMKFMDGTIIPSGSRYSFLTNVGNGSSRYGYKTAGITGGDGIGVGGGICHTGTLTYFSALSLPLYIYEREPHTADGTHYSLLEFDATVGGWSDFSYINTLPYDIKEHAFIDRNSGTITILWECLETLDEDVLKNWDWKTLNIETSPEEL